MDNLIGSVKVRIGDEAGASSAGSGVFIGESSQSFPVQPPARAAVAVVFDMSGLECKEACEVLADVEFTDLHPDEMPLLASVNGEFWVVAAPSSPGMLWENIEDALSEQSSS